MFRRLTTAAGPPPKNGLPPAHTYKGWEERRQGRFRRKVRPQGPTTWSLSPPATQLAAPQPPAASPSPCPESIMSRLRRDAAAHAVKVRVSSQGWGYGGLKSSPVLAVKPVISRGRYCIRLRRVLTSAATWSMVRLARLARLVFRCDHTASTGFSSGA